MSRKLDEMFCQGDGKDDCNQRQLAYDDGGRIRSADWLGGLSRQIQPPAGTPWRQDGGDRGDGLGRARMRKRMAGTPGTTSPGGPAKWGRFRQGQQSLARPDSPGSAVQGANVWNDRGVGFVPNGNAGVNNGSENPGALHPTRQVMGNTAIVTMRHVRVPCNSSGSARVGKPCSAPDMVRRACHLPYCYKDGTLARRFCGSNDVQLGAGEPPVAAIGIGFHDVDRHDPDTVNQSVAGQLQSRRGTTLPRGWPHVPCNAWATGRRSTPSNPFDSVVGRFQKYPRR